VIEGSIRGTRFFGEALPVLSEDKLAYSVFACLRMGIAESASCQRARKY